MDVEMVFNELSLDSPAQNVYAARERMLVFIQTMALAAGKFGVKRVLRLEKEHLSLSLTRDGAYSINQWRNDRTVDREAKRYFNSVQTKYPALAGFEGSPVEDDYLLFEFAYGDKKNHGLAVAYLLDGLALSIDSHSQWRVSKINLEFSGETVAVYHASRPDHIRQNSEWIKQRLIQKNPWVKNGLPQAGECPYKPAKNYYRDKKIDFPSKLYGGSIGFVDYKDQIWVWDKEERHWDVQFKPHRRGNYFRVAPDGRLLDEKKGE